MTAPGLQDKILEVHTPKDDSILA